MIIRDSAALSRLCADFRARGSFALDTEFIRERTYAPRLCLVQVAGAGTAAAVDPLAGVDLVPLLDLVDDPAVEVVVHAGWQDFEIFRNRTGRLPRRVFDTQIAAAMAGLGSEIGYGTLVGKVLGVSLTKVETVTDWCRRPLTPAQLEYALDDVRYLLPLRDRLAAALGELGRTGPFLEESRRYEDPGSYERDPRAQCLRYRGARSLSPAALAVLRELAAWREGEAIRRDVPRGRIVSDETLVEVARRSPRSIDDLRRARGLFPKEIERSGKEILLAIERGVAVPETERPALRPARAEDPDRALLVDFLELTVKVRARAARIAPGLLASRAELAEIVDARAEGREPVGEDPGRPPAILAGWRRALAGEEVLRALEGRLSMTVDPAKRTVESVGRT